MKLCDRKTDFTNSELLKYCKNGYFSTVMSTVFHSLSHSSFSGTLKSFTLNHVLVPDWLFHPQMAVITGRENLYVTCKGCNLRHIDCETSSHPGETSHLSGIAAEWCISLFKSKLCIWKWIHPTQLRSHVNAGEKSLSWGWIFSM